MIPLSLYLHIPWCKSRCIYCCFLSYLYKNDLNTFKKYILSFINDLKNNFDFKNDNRKIFSIYIGGGTPSLLNLNIISFLFDKLFFYSNLFYKNIEITIECNVDDINLKKINYYYSLGINRISLGVQTFNDYILKIINRNYSFYDIKKSIDILNNSNFSNINIDLIYGLPNQSYQDILNDLNYAIKFNIPHISWYELCFNKRNKFLKYKSNFFLENIYFKGLNLFKKNNYIQYEVSSFCKSNNYFCLHNINYWKFGDYFGIGCGSHSKITLFNNKIYRLIKNNNLYKYINGYYLYNVNLLNNKDIIFEYFLCRWRLFFSFNINEFYLNTKLSKNKIKKYLKWCLLKKYIYINKNNYNLTNYSKLLLDYIYDYFL